MIPPPVVCTDQRCTAGRERRVHRDDAELMACGMLDALEGERATRVRVVIVAARFEWGPSTDPAAIIERCHQCGALVWIDRVNAPLALLGARLLCAPCWNPELAERVRRGMARRRAAALS